MGAWLIAHKDQISSGTALIGILTAAVGFSITGCQMHETAVALRAANSYAISKDARDLTDKNQTIPNYVETVYAKTTQSLTPEIETGLWKVFNFYKSVFREEEAGGLPPEFIRSYSRDFCDFVKMPTVETAWRSMLAQGAIGDKESAMRKDWCP